MASTHKLCRTTHIFVDACSWPQVAREGEPTPAAGDEPSLYSMHSTRAQLALALHKTGTGAGNQQSNAKTSCMHALEGGLVRVVAPPPTTLSPLPEPCVRQPSSCASHPPTPLLPTALGVVVAQRVPKAEHAAGWRGVRLRGTGANAAGGMRGGVRERSEKKVGAGSTRRGEHKHTQQGRPGRLGGPGSRHAGVQEPPPQKRSP